MKQDWKKLHILQDTSWQCTFPINRGNPNLLSLGSKVRILGHLGHCKNVQQLLQLNSVQDCEADMCVAAEHGPSV